MLRCTHDCHNPTPGKQSVSLAKVSLRRRFRRTSLRNQGQILLTIGKVHFGRARVKVSFVNNQGMTAFLTGYAYEAIAGKSIKAGQTKEAADDPANEDFGPGASLNSPVPDKPQPISLGMQALGAQGVPVWRRKENESVVQGN